MFSFHGAKRIYRAITGSCKIFHGAFPCCLMATFLSEFYPRIEKFVSDQYHTFVSSCSSSSLDYCTYSYTYVKALISLCGASPYRQYSAYIALIANTSRGACIYSERKLRDRLKFSYRLRRRCVAPLWKLGRNWPEFNPGIQFAVVFVPREVNPIDARGRRFRDLICVY